MTTVKTSNCKHVLGNKQSGDSKLKQYKFNAFTDYNSEQPAIVASSTDTMNKVVPRAVVILYRLEIRHDL